MKSHHTHPDVSPAVLPDRQRVLRSLLDGEGLGSRDRGVLRQICIALAEDAQISESSLTCTQRGNEARHLQEVA